MKIVIGSDHAGVRLKDVIKKEISGVEFIDVGTNSESSCDYPDYISKVAETVRSGGADFGIAICGTGIGASIVANKFDGIRAALCFNEFMAEMTRRHNNANILVLGSRVIGEGLAISIVKKFMSESFEGGRHQARLDKITAMEFSRKKNA
jgi:ribose 5-phosphate isomerase B